MKIILFCIETKWCRPIFNLNYIIETDWQWTYNFSKLLSEQKRRRWLCTWKIPFFRSWQYSPRLLFIHPCGAVCLSCINKLWRKGGRWIISIVAAGGSLPFLALLFITKCTFRQSWFHMLSSYIVLHVLFILKGETCLIICVFLVI